MYTWIVVAGGIFSFVAAMGIGANDVANAFATSVGSKSLSMKEAVVLASIFETSGALFMGSHVTKTIRKGIADYECFENDPGALMYGCMCVCFSVGMWLFIASRYEMPVSTTHSCVGGMIGMTIALKGVDCVTWYEPRDTFPYIGGVSGIVVSWFVSPMLSAIISTSLFATIRCLVLRSTRSFDRTTYLFPLLIGSVVTLNAFFIVYKGAKGLGLDDTPFDVACVWSFGIGTVVAVVVCPFTGHIRKRVNRKFGAVVDIDAVEDGQIFDVTSYDQETDQETEMNRSKHEEGKPGCCYSIVQHVEENLNKDLDLIVNDNNRVTEIHTDAEKFDPKTEEYFKSLQVFTAICASFSHGANDVANAIGPFAAIYLIGRDGAVHKNNDLESDAYWILGFGGVGITIGLILYGYKIIYAIGLKLCKITPSRGVAIELASAIVIIGGSRLEIPLSTTHCQVGATIGVAALENPRTCAGVNWTIVWKTIFGWVITLIVVGTSTALLTAQGTYAPEVGVRGCEF